VAWGGESADLLLDWDEHRSACEPGREPGHSLLNLMRDIYDEPGPFLDLDGPLSLSDLGNKIKIK